MALRSLFSCDINATSLGTLLLAEVYFVLMKGCHNGGKAKSRVHIGHDWAS